MGRQLEVKHALGVARRFHGGLCVALQQAYLPAAHGQAVGRGATGQARADDQGVAFGQRCTRAGEPGGRSIGGWRIGRPGVEHAAQDFPLMADARHPLHGEAGCLERTPHPAGAGEGAQGSAGRGQARQLREEFRGPHFRVFRWCKTVEKPGIDLAIDQR
ncbi:hypothetical protein D3C85_926590 [compost metagenome]